MKPERVRRRRDLLVERVRQTGENSLASGERRAHRASVAKVDGMDGERRIGKRARVDACDIEPGVGQKLSGEAADLAEAEHGDFGEHPRRSPLSATFVAAARS